MLRLLLFAFALTPILCTPAIAVDYVWDAGGAADNWDTNAASGAYTNWTVGGNSGNPLSLPEFNDDVQFGSDFVGGAFAGDPQLNVDATVNSLQISHDSSQVILADAGGTLTLFSGQLTRSATSSGTQDITANIELGADGLWQISGDSGSPGRLDIGGAISGAYGLTKTGNTTLRFEGTTANTYSGTTTIQGGRLTLAKTPFVDAIAGDVVIDSTNGNSPELYWASDEQIADNATVTMNGSSATFSLNGRTETFDTLEANAGTIAFSSGSLTVATLNGSAVLFMDGGDLTVGNGDFSGTVFGSSATITKTTNGTLDYRSSSPGFSGTVNIDNGTLRLDTPAASAFSDSIVNINTNSGLNINVNDVDAVLGALAGTGNWGIGNNTVTVGARSVNTTYSGSLIGQNGGVFNKVGTGTLTLSGEDNIYNLSGTFNVNNGTVRIASTNALDNASVNLNVGGGNPNLIVETGVDAVIQNLQIGANAASAYTCTVMVDGSGTGLTLLDTTGLTIGYDGNGVAKLNVTNSGTFTVANSASSATINATGQLNVKTGGTFNLFAPLDVVGGAVSINAATFNGLGDAGAGTNAGGTGRTVTLDSDATFEVTNGGLVDLRGGAGNNTESTAGGNGGSLVIQQGSFTMGTDAVLDLRGGAGGDFGDYSTMGGNGGAGGSLLLSSGSLSVDTTATIKLQGGKSEAFTPGEFGAAGSMTLAGGTADIQGTVNLKGLDDNHEENRRGGQQGGAFLMSAGVATIGGTIDLEGGSANDNNPEELASGGNGGTFDLTGGDLTIQSTGFIDLKGGSSQEKEYLSGTSNPGLAGTFTQSGSSTLTLEDGGIINLQGGPSVTGVKGKKGGTYTQTGGTAMLAGKINASGRPGSAENDAPAQQGSGGGVFAISGGVATLSGTLELQGKDGGFASSGSGARGGNGGSVEVTGGEFILDGGTIDLGFGVGGFGDEGSGAAGNAGSINVSGGKLTLHSGSILGETSITATASVLMHNATLNVTGGDVEFTASAAISGSKGSVVLSGGSATATTFSEVSDGDFEFTGGTLSVELFEGTLTQQGGTLSPGASPGLTEIDGDYEFEAGTLAIELAGNGGVAGTDFDQVIVTGTATLAGSLSVDLLDGFTPAGGDSFTVLTAASLVGDLANVATGGRLITAAGEGSFLVSYDGTSNSVVLTDFIAGLPGDYNNDGTVDLADYTVWRNHLGGTAGTLPNDTDGGTIGLAQYTTWKANFGATQTFSSALANTSVPEPGTLGLMLAAGLLMGLRKKLWRKG